MSLRSIIFRLTFVLLYHLIIEAITDYNTNLVLLICIPVSISAFISEIKLFIFISSIYPVILLEIPYKIETIIVFSVIPLFILIRETFLNIKEGRIKPFTEPEKKEQAPITTTQPISSGNKAHKSNDIVFDLHRKGIFHLDKQCSQEMKIIYKSILQHYNFKFVKTNYSKVFLFEDDSDSTVVDEEILKDLVLDKINNLLVKIQAKLFYDEIKIDIKALCWLLKNYKYSEFGNVLGNYLLKSGVPPNASPIITINSDNYLEIGY